MGTYEEDVNELYIEIEDLKDENARLRKALRAIQNAAMSPCNDIDVRWKMDRIAIDALKPTAGEGSND